LAQDRRAIGQHYDRLDTLAGQGPVAARDIPIDFVVVGEVTDLTVGPVDQGIGVFPRRQKDVGLSDVDDVAIRYRIDAKRLRTSVALYVQNVECHPQVSSLPIAIMGWECAKDAMRDDASFGPHPQRFDHRQRGVGVDGDAASIVEDGLVCRGRSDGRQPQQQAGQQPQEGETPVHVTAPAGAGICGKHRECDHRLPRLMFLGPRRSDHDGNGVGFREEGKGYRRQMVAWPLLLDNRPMIRYWLAR